MKNIRIHVLIITAILRLITSGFKDQNFLGSPLIPFLFKLTPKKYRRSLALRLIGISPHYFIYQYTTRYPATMSRKEILEAEHRRNSSSRSQICEKILKRWLQPHMDVLDFGCGLGYLAREAAKYSKNVVAVDVSCGVIACAKELNSSSNISYYVNDGKCLSMLDGSTIDLIYSFAVVQHLSEELFEGILKEFFRVLKPQGKVICHITLSDQPFTKSEHKINSFVTRFIKKRILLDMHLRTLEDVRQKIIKAGFKEPNIILAKQICDIEDDIVKQHLFIFSKL